MMNIESQYKMLFDVYKFIEDYRKSRSVTNQKNNVSTKNNNDLKHHNNIDAETVPNNKNNGDTIDIPLIGK